MNKNKIEEFDWSKYDEHYKGGNKLVSNPKIKGQSNKEKCYSREPYAQKMFDFFTSNNQTIIKKDLNKGDCIPIISIYNIRDGKMNIELISGLTVTIDLNREKRFIQLFGYNTIDEFITALQNPENLKNFINQGLYVYIIEGSPNIKVSLWQGHIKRTKEEFMKEINSPSKAYIAKILEANKGGFFVEVQGIEAFMPGSLAAPNKIMDFKSMVGKEVIVMIEDFLKEMNSFIVSHKKYIEHVLPKKISELSLDKKYKGNITGTSKYGIFIEFEDIFTGLLHHSKMYEETINSFRNKKFKPGDEIEFYINEITKDNRIILTEEDPFQKRKKINEFILKNKDNNIEAEIVAIMPFGIIVKVEEIAGLVPSKEFKKNKILMSNFIVGDKLNIKYEEFKENDKLIFKLTNNK